MAEKEGTGRHERGTEVRTGDDRRDRADDDAFYSGRRSYKRLRASAADRVTAQDRRPFRGALAGTRPRREKAASGRHIGSASPRGETTPRLASATRRRGIRPPRCGARPVLYVVGSALGAGVGIAPGSPAESRCSHHVCTTRPREPRSHAPASSMFVTRSRRPLGRAPTPIGSTVRYISTRRGPNTPTRSTVTSSWKASPPTASARGIPDAVSLRSWIELRIVTEDGYAAMAPASSRVPATDLSAITARLPHRYSDDRPRRRPGGTDLHIAHLGATAAAKRHGDAAPSASSSNTGSPAPRRPLAHHRQRHLQRHRLLRQYALRGRRSFRRHAHPRRPHDRVPARTNVFFPSGLRTSSTSPSMWCVRRLPGPRQGPSAWTPTSRPPGTWAPSTPSVGAPAFLGVCYYVATWLRVTEGGPGASSKVSVVIAPSR